MKILMITRYFYPFLGGNENQCYLLSKHLSKLDVKITVVTSKYKSILNRNETLDGFNIIRLRHFSFIYNYIKRNIFNRILRYITVLLAEWSYMIRIFLFLVFSKKEYDVFHVHKASWIAIPVVIAGKLLKKKVYIKIAGISELFESKLVLIPNFVVLSLYKNVYFFAISTEIKAELLRLNFKENQIISIFNGLEVNTLFEKKRNPDEILFIGNYVHRTIKGLDILLKASEKVLDIYPETKFIIIGDGNPLLFEGIVDSNIFYKNFKFLGKILNVKNYLELSTIFVLPSRREGMSNSLLEAMSYGIPCIASNISGSNDIIESGKNGFLFESEDFNTLADLIIELLTDSKKRIEFGVNAQRRIRNEFDINVISRKYFQVYSK